MSKSLKILVIDANREAGRFTAGLCRSIGLETETAETIGAALTAYKEHQHELALAEVEFPDGTGLDLIRRLKELGVPGRSTILVHTQVRGSLEVVRRAAIEAGADGVLPKPLNVQNLSHYLSPSQGSPSNRLAEAERSSDKPGELAGRAAHDGGGNVLQSGTHAAVGVAIGAEQGLGPAPAEEPSVRNAAGTAQSDRAGTQSRQLFQPASTSDPRVRIATVPEPYGRVDVTRLAVKDHSLISVLETVATEETSQAIKVETDKGTWLELTYHNRSICDVRAWGIGPDIVDVALREGLLDSSIALRVRLDLLDKGERLAQRILGRVGVDNDAIARLFQITSMERIIAACQVEQGVLTVMKGVQPRFIGLPVALPLFGVVSEIVDRTFKLAMVVEAYGRRSRDVMHKTVWFGDVLPGGVTAARDKMLLDKVGDGQSVSGWLRAHRSDMSDACLLLRKLEICGAVRIEPGDDLESGDLDEGEVSRKQGDSSPSRRGIVDIPSLSIEPPASGSGKFVLPPEPARSREPVDGTRGRQAPIDRALENLLTAYIEETPESSAGNERPSPGGSGEPSPAERFEPAGELSRSTGKTVEQRPSRRVLASRPMSPASPMELDELGSEACESWLHTMSPLLLDEAKGQVPEELAGHVSRKTTPGSGTPTHRFILGLAAISQGKLDSARVQLSEALREVPKDRWINAALALLQTGYFSRPNSDLSVEGVWKTIRNVATQKGSADR